MVSAVIVAAGRGTRMGPGVDKLFLEVAGRPVVAHAWARFDAAPGVDEIVLVVRAGLEDAFAELAEAAAAVNTTSSVTPSAVMISTTSG